jgi:hypothetical protein
MHLTPMYPLSAVIRFDLVMTVGALLCGPCIRTLICPATPGSTRLIRSIPLILAFLWAPRLFNAHDEILGERVSYGSPCCSVVEL